MLNKIFAARYNCLMSTIPSFVKEYLWDTKVDEIDLNKNSKFVIERVLEYGDFDALNWLNKTFDVKQIEDVLRTSKKISTKTGNFFALYYNIPKSKLRCIQKPFTQKQKRF